MASAEGGSVSSGVAYGEVCPLSSRLRGLGERRELPQRGPGLKSAIYWDIATLEHMPLHRRNLCL